MALRVWLPLNENLKNYGLSSTTVTNSGATVDNNGKIGKCYYFNRNKYLIGNGPLSNSTLNFSIAFWVKYDNLTNYHCMYSQRTVTGKGITVWKNADHIRFDDGSQMWETPYTLTANVWIHVTVTRTSSEKKLYINGELKSTTTSGSLNSVSSKFTIGMSSSNNDTTAPNANSFYGRLNDVRIYDHALSAKEVKEISKGLILHYKLNNSDNIYDCSGYGNDGTITGTLTTDNDSPRYTASTVFSNDSYIAAGRNVFVKDEVSMCCWAYMSNWSSFNARLFSCTQTGGWALYPRNSKMSVIVGTGESSNAYKYSDGTLLSNLSSGWHHFVGTYDGFKVCIYTDGVLITETVAYTTKTPIYYDATNGLFIGAEAGTSAITPVSPYFSGKISDARIYATALSEDDVKELYNTSAFLTNNGTLFGYELDETINTIVNKNGIVESGQFIEMDSEQPEFYQSKIKASRFNEI